MPTAIGQPHTKVITIRDELNVPILGLLEDDFIVLEAYRISSPGTVALVILDEIDGGQYALSCTPTEAGSWAIHYVYDVSPVFREETEVFQVDTTAEIVVITSGGTWTYAGDLTDPSQEVRFLIQDTDGSNPLFVDTEISYALGFAGGSPRGAAVSLVQQLMMRYAAMADTTELDLSVRASQLYDHYKDLLATLTGSLFKGSSVVPYAGGISHGDIRSNQADRDRVAGIFERLPMFSRSDWGGIRH